MSSVSKLEINPVDFDDARGLYDLLTDAYAFMEGRIDPTSFLTKMDVGDVAQKARDEDLVVVREDGRAVACLFGTGTGDTYEVGKIAVAATHRKRGLCRAMIDAAADLARGRGYTVLQLFARVELTENHETYRRQGFTVAGPFTHDGYDRPTALIFQRPL
jgi:ribosomal protein S18 acetylase RimI-like enzyme